MLMLTSPHSGEVIPAEAFWIKNRDALILLTDVDRFVDELYRPGCETAKVPLITMDINRYVLDLNRLPTDVDASIVEGTSASSEIQFISGFHWKKTTHGASLMDHPLSQKLHQEIIQKYYLPFHARVKAVEETLIAQHRSRFHLDVHSMPSVGTSVHRDQGKKRPDIVVSDCSGTSCAPEFKDRVIQAYQRMGFEVAYNWPYLGGRMTEMYGHPKEGRHSVQVELNRGLYMNEKTKERLPAFDSISERLSRVIQALNPIKNNPQSNML